MFCRDELFLALMQFVTRLQVYIILYDLKTIFDVLQNPGQLILNYVPIL